MEKLLKLIEETKTTNFKITKSTKGEQLQQTQRNKLKKDLIQALQEDIKTKYPYVFRGKDGIILEIANDSVADNITNELGSGSITIAIDIKVKDLETNAENLAEDYAIDLAEKEEKAKKKAEQKARKIAEDTKRRKGE